MVLLVPFCLVYLTHMSGTPKVYDQTNSIYKRVMTDAMACKTVIYQVTFGERVTAWSVFKVFADKLFLGPSSHSENSLKCLRDLSHNWYPHNIVIWPIEQHIKETNARKQLF